MEEKLSLSATSAQSPFWLPMLSSSTIIAGSLVANDRLAATSEINFNPQKVNLQQQQQQENQENEAILILSRQQPFKETSSSEFNLLDQRSQATTLYSDFLFQYVNFKLVRKMIGQNLLAVLFICVIIIYLIYYFSQISKRPKLIGNNRSRFVEFIRKHFRDKTLAQRFSPLIYFWGTNMQTALFGYLQGQSSVNEMPRNEFTRQYLYVSDAQYLNSNVDLSKHYLQKEDNNQKSGQKNNCPKTGSKNHRLVQLQAIDLGHERGGIERDVYKYSSLNKNIQLALNDILGEKERKVSQKELMNQERYIESNEINNKSSESNNSTEESDDQEESDNLSTYSKRVSTSSGSSSDSGVHAGGAGSSHSNRSSTSASSSTPSLSSEQLGTPGQCDCGDLLYSTSGCCHLLNSKEISYSHSQQQVQKEQLEFGQCALDWYKLSHKHYHENKLVALISAGMTTGSDKKYVTDTVKTLEQLGYEVCVFIRRGVGGLKLSSTKFFSPAKWRDFEAAILSIKEQRPGAHLVSIGFSFGSIELCRYLSMSGKRSLINAALLVSCPFDPAAGGNNMRKRILNRKIDAYLAKHLGKQLHSAMFSQINNSNSNVHSPMNNCPTISEQLMGRGTVEFSSTFSNYNGSLVNLASLPKVKSLADFESNYNRILQNYPNLEAYATDCRLQNHLAFIETPTLCLSSEDDFMAPLKLLPLDQIKANKNLCMILTKRGGHMAFIDGLLWPKKPYFAQRIIGKYMESVKVVLLNEKLSASMGASDINARTKNKEHHFIQMFE